MVVFGQSCFIQAKMVIFGLKWLYSDKVVVFFGQNSLFSGKEVVFAQKWL